MIILAKNYGQLGNRLLLSAHLIAAARHYGVSLINPSFAEYAQYFPATANDLWCRYPTVTDTDPAGASPPSEFRRRATYQAVYLAARGLWHLGMTRFPLQLIRLRGDESCDLAGDEFAAKVTSRRPVVVSGWGFRSGLLDDHADAVRDHFRIQPVHQANIDRLMRTVRSGAGTVVGVHIRHGDYAKWGGGRYFYSIPQYVAAMQRIADQLSRRDVSFLVCSNVPLQRSDFAGLDVHFGTGHLIEDMYALARTDLLVGPPSTFTGWASFYGGPPLMAMETADQQFDLTALRGTGPASRVA